jgi:hypothetical protein
MHVNTHPVRVMIAHDWCPFEWVRGMDGRFMHGWPSMPWSSGLKHDGCIGVEDAGFITDKYKGYAFQYDTGKTIITLPGLDLLDPTSHPQYPATRPGTSRPTTSGTERELYRCFPNSMIDVPQEGVVDLCSDLVKRIHPKLADSLSSALLSQLSGYRETLFANSGRRAYMRLNVGGSLVGPGSLPEIFLCADPRYDIEILPNLKMRWRLRSIDTSVYLRPPDISDPGLARRYILAYAEYLYRVCMYVYEKS